MTTSPDERIRAALDRAIQSAGVEGEHHKQWVIDQMIRCLTGCPVVRKHQSAFDRLGESEEYLRWVEEYEDGGGSYYGGYMYTKIANAADDCLDDEERTYELTRLFGELLRTLEEPARDVSYAEACDSSEESAAISILNQMPSIRAALGDLQFYCEHHAERRGKLNPTPTPEPS